jgi:hypothetical protein
MTRTGNNLRKKANAQQEVWRYGGLTNISSALYRQAQAILVTFSNFFYMKYIKLLLVSFLLSQCFLVNGQTENSEENFAILKPPQSSIVKQHKDNLKLTLIVDSIVLGQRKVVPNFHIATPISFESDYIQVRDSLYLKIFISRNQEYGSKFYSWKWDFLKKKNGRFYSQGQSQYGVMDYNGILTKDDWSQGHGVGVKGTPEYVMYYYRYKLE